jgi:hypothetical protein
MGLEAPEGIWLWVFLGSTLMWILLFIHFFGDRPAAALGAPLGYVTFRFLKYLSGIHWGPILLLLVGFAIASVVILACVLIRICLPAVSDFCRNVSNIFRGAPSSYHYPPPPPPPPPQEEVYINQGIDDGVPYNPNQNN